MTANKAAKVITKIYARTLLSEWGELTQGLRDRIENGDEVTIREILVKQKKQDSLSSRK